MYLIPMGMWLAGKTSAVGISQLMYNMIPVTLGNIVGGAVCVAGMYALIFGNAGKSI